MAGAIYEMAGIIWAEMRADFDRALESRYAEAEAATNGYMVNRLGRSAGVTGYDLHTGPADRAYRYASRELLDHWNTRPRLSLALFEADWLTSRGGFLAFAADVEGLHM